MEGRDCSLHGTFNRLSRPHTKQTAGLMMATTFVNGSSQKSPRKAASKPSRGGDRDDSVESHLPSLSDSDDELDLLSSPSRQQERKKKPNARETTVPEHTNPEYRPNKYINMHFTKTKSGASNRTSQSSQSSSSCPATSSQSRVPPAKSSSQTKQITLARQPDKPTPQKAVDVVDIHDPPAPPERPRPRPLKKLENKRPVSYPTRSPTTIDCDMSPSKPSKKGKEKAIQREPSFHSPLQNTSNEATKRPARSAQPFPMTFPLSPRSNSSSKPNRKLTTSPSKPKKKAVHSRILSSEEPSDTEPTKQAKPFPMALSPLHLPKRKAQPFPVSRSPMATPRQLKRASPDRAESPTRKKRRDDFTSSLQLRDIDDLPHEDDSMFFNPETTDAKTLCPYCDERLPENPTTLLSKLLISLVAKSRTNPRPTNPLGRKAPVTVFIPVCQRHRFESQILPEAEAKGWPKEIAFDKLEGRVRKMKNDLRALLTDPEVRKNSKFWAEVLDEVKAKGSRAMAGVRNQYANFDKMQPGYYGEQGSVIIQHTLFDMFPPATISQSDIMPLSPNEFTQRILVPEVAKFLIMEDQKVDIVKAIKILRESTSYGVAMFPEDGGEWGEKKHKNADETMSVADKMVMERARKRRLELEREDKEEDKQKQREMEKKGRPKPRPLSKKKPSPSDDGGSSNPATDDDFPITMSLGSDEDHYAASDTNDNRGSQPWKTRMHDSDDHTYSDMDDNYSESWLRSLPVKESPIKKGRDIFPTSADESSRNASPVKRRKPGKSALHLAQTSESDLDTNYKSGRKESKWAKAMRARSKSPSVEIGEVEQSSPPVRRKETAALDVDATPRPRGANFNPLAAARRMGPRNVESSVKKDFDWLIGDN